VFSNNIGFGLGYLETTRFGEVLKAGEGLKELNLFGRNRASGCHHSFFFFSQSLYLLFIYSLNKRQAIDKNVHYSILYYFE